MVPFVSQAPLRILQAVLEDMAATWALIKPVEGQHNLREAKRDSTLPLTWPENVARTWRGASTRVWQTRHYPVQVASFQR
jgi:hypothetical protein